MSFDLVISAPEGDIVLGSYETRTAAEKMAAIAAPPGERWSVVEVAGEGDAGPAAVLDFASYQAKRRARRLKDQLRGRLDHLGQYAAKARPIACEPPAGTRASRHGHPTKAEMKTPTAAARLDGAAGRVGGELSEASG